MTDKLPLNNRDNENISLIKGFLIGRDAPKEIIDIFDTLFQSNGTPEEIIELDVWDCEFSVRVMNILKEENIKCLKQLADRTISDMLKIPNCGKVSVREMQMALQSKGLKFRECYRSSFNEYFKEVPSNG